MLQQFSWTTFLIFFAIVTALWYLALLFTVYRKEAKAFISGSFSRPPSLSPGEHVSEENQSTVPELDIMGKSRMPEGLDLVGMGALNFSIGDHSTYSNEDQKLDQLGLVPDVIQELKEIFGILEKENGSKQDFFAMAAMITEKYGRIGSNPNIGKINEFIRDHSPFAITQEELEYLWD